MALSEDPREIVDALRSGSAAPELKLFAARGLLPLERDDQLRAMLAVVQDPDPLLAGTARETLRAQAPEELTVFLRGADPTGVELDVLASASEDPFVLEQVIRHRNVDDITLASLAGRVTGNAQDALVVNQVRLLRNPTLIDALFGNPELTADNRRRLSETREEFFEKEIRRRETEAREKEEHEALEAQAKLVAEQAHLIGELPVPAGEAGEEPADEEAHAHAIHSQIQTMTVAEKIQLAYGGGKEERRILIQDSNKLVALAVMKSRGLTVNEVEAFCMMRHLDDEIFRKIAVNREWMRRPSIVSAMVRNPSVPLALTLPLVKSLGLRELRSVVKDPNLPEGLRTMARRFLEEKRR